MVDKLTKTKMNHVESIQIVENSKSTNSHKESNLILEIKNAESSLVIKLPSNLKLFVNRYIDCVSTYLDKTLLEGIFFTNKSNQISNIVDRISQFHWLGIIKVHDTRRMRFFLIPKEKFPPKHFTTQNIFHAPFNVTYHESQDILEAKQSKVSFLTVVLDFSYDMLILDEMNITSCHYFPKLFDQYELDMEQFPYLEWIWHKYHHFSSILKVKRELKPLKECCSNLAINPVNSMLFCLSFDVGESQFEILLKPFQIIELMKYLIEHISFHTKNYFPFFSHYKQMELE